MELGYLFLHNMHENSIELEILIGEGRGNVVSLLIVDLTPLDTTHPFSFKRM